VTPLTQWAPCSNRLATIRPPGCRQRSRGCRQTPNNPARKPALTYVELRGFEPRYAQWTGLIDRVRVRTLRCRVSGAKGIRTPDLLDANESTWVFVTSNCVGCARNLLVRALGAMANGSSNKFCCVPAAYRLQRVRQTRSSSRRPRFLAGLGPFL
jgi:hypothetical protein